MGSIEKHFKAEQAIEVERLQGEMTKELIKADRQKSLYAKDEEQVSTPMWHPPLRMNRYL